tara:strand:+ start:547 stop:753 length:207 start_codon:yes stop_codon:yes gene_type:complete
LLESSAAATPRQYLADLLGCTAGPFNYLADAAGYSTKGASFGSCWLITENGRRYYGGQRGVSHVRSFI